MQNTLYNSLDCHEFLLASIAQQKKDKVSVWQNSEWVCLKEVITSRKMMMNMMTMMMMMITSVEAPLTATALQRPLFFVPAEKKSYIDSCLKPLYNGHFLLFPRWPFVKKFNCIK